MPWKRNYQRIDEHYQELLGDIYPQPPDAGHTKMAVEAIEDMATWITEAKNVLDVGCGHAFLQDIFEGKGLEYTGCCLGDDFEAARTLGKNVKYWDFSFLPVADNSFGLIFARHVLEHSPFPILTLMEWHRVSSWGLYLISPDPKHYTFAGRNHYSVAEAKQIRWWLRRAGWRVIWRSHKDNEFRYFCKKFERKGYEGWAETPLSEEILRDERDNP